MCDILYSISKWTKLTCFCDDCSSRCVKLFYIAAGMGEEEIWMSVYCGAVVKYQVFK